MGRAVIKIPLRSIQYYYKKKFYTKLYSTSNPLIISTKMERKKTGKPVEPNYRPPKVKFSKAVFVGSYVESMMNQGKTLQNMIYIFTIEYRDQIWHPQKRYQEIHELFEFVRHNITL